jgi:hypothetical protein
MNTYYGQSCTLNEGEDLWYYSNISIPMNFKFAYEDEDPEWLED